MNRVHLQQQQQSCGPWELKERLGTGGFGNVTKWQNKVRNPPASNTVSHLYPVGNFVFICGCDRTK